MAAQQCACTCSPPVPRAAQEFMYASPAITFADRWDHFLARWGVNRMGHVVQPGLYKLGLAIPESPVFASANYTLSFDALRSALAGIDAYILVLDTRGINIWCAAGKGTFGTDELVRRIDATGLSGIVSHRRIILPQLGAPGVSAHEVSRRSGFSVEYGPVRARDLPAYLATHTATREMRTVRFTLADRLVLAPVELVHILLPMIAAAVVLYFLAGPVAALAAVSAVFAGTILFPALLPVIPTRDFSTKGFILGAIVAIPFAATYALTPGLSGIGLIITVLVPLLIMPAVTAYLALNFTGSTTFTSRTGVKKEIFRYVPVMVIMAGAGTLLGIALGVLHLMGVA
ncbi:MAG: mercury methylation corrinoid protein HgcA [Methanoregula sp.]|uniref:mercury methylation corrinoid protein HgcA n=1 Tax=Methanoregula sp. TaxID=2052170 RepID=UPI003BB0323E